MVSHWKNWCLVLVVAALLPSVGSAQDQKCVNDAPNPYTLLGKWGDSEGRAIGSTAGIDVSPDGHIWVADRCGGTTCVGSSVAPVLEFTTDGKPVKSIGAGLFVFPHGLTVDRQGNIWVTDGRSEGNLGMQAIKFSPGGKVLMRLGVAGTFEGEGALDQPTSVAIAKNGDIFVAEGHNPNYRRSQVDHYSKSGKLLSVISTKGMDSGQIYGPHSLAIDSKGRLFVADRNNNRISIFDAKGKFVTSWKQFSRPSGIYIDKNDKIYVADSESNDGTGYGSNPGCKPGIRIGSARDGKVVVFIPAAPETERGNPAAEGITVDATGTIYGAVSGTKGVRKYVIK
jgi:DNA-binding beta-propeller fold protein YncE